MMMMGTFSVTDAATTIDIAAFPVGRVRRVAGGGMDDCYSSNDKHRHSTPFCRHGLGMTQSSRWVPKAKVKTVSFADPIVSAVWPQVDSLGLTDGGGSKSGSIGVDNQETSHNPTASKCKVTNTVDLTNVFATIHNSLDSVLVLNTSIPAKALAVQPIEFLGSQLLNDNQAIDYNMPAADRVGLMCASIIHDLPDPVFQPVVSDNQPDFQLVDSDNHETLRASPALRTGNSSTDNTQLLDFIAAITNPPEPPLIPSPLKSSTTTSHPLKFQNQPTTRRSSVRLAAKKCIKTGSNRDAISKAQEIILAKLNNSTVKKSDCSSSSGFTDFDDSFEQIASLFTRPLSKKQMEAIMELKNQDNVKAVRTKKKGRKVVPAIKAVKAKGI
jgi:hypothetical protein